MAPFRGDDVDEHEQLFDNFLSAFDAEALRRHANAADKPVAEEDGAAADEPRGLPPGTDEVPAVLDAVLDDIKQLSRRRFAQYHRPGDGPIDNVRRIGDFAGLSLRETVAIFVLKHLGVLSDPHTKATDLEERAQDIILYTALLIASGDLNR